MSLFRIASILVLWGVFQFTGLQAQQEVLLKRRGFGQKLLRQLPSLSFSFPFLPKSDLEKQGAAADGSPDGRSNGSG